MPQLFRPSTSGSVQFDLLRQAIAKDRQLRNDIEALMLLVVETYNPSDRGVRFITGGIGEWLLAMAAYAAGVITVPEGHNANGFDLSDVLSESKALWSVKSSNSSTGEFIISNGRDGPGRGLVDPTVFWSPELPGFVFVDPELHADVTAEQRLKKDSTTLAKAVIARHAAQRPECVAELLIPRNPGTATRDPAFEAVKLLVEGGNFPRLRRLLDDGKRMSSSVVDQIQELRRMRDAGDLSAEQFRAAVDKVTS